MSIKVSELPPLSSVTGSTLLAVVDTTGTSTSKKTSVDAIKTHTLLGNAATATKLATPVEIAGNSFDGSANISITPTQIGLGNVTNESKATMFTSPTFTGTVTIPAGASISGFAPLASPAFTGTVTGVSKSMVGLGLVENTALSTWAGSGNITALGTVVSGSAPANDVYSWAKQPSKPSYSAGEVGLGNVTNESKSTMFSSPTFTGTVTVPTPASNSNTTVAASTAFVTSAVSTAVSNLVNGAGTALDTLKELADALGGDSNFATSVSTSLGLKAPIANPTFTGTVTIPAGASISGYALLNSPSFTTPTLGVATATSINKMAITAPASGSTLSIADGKTFTVSNSITLAGSDTTTITLPSTNGTVALNNQTVYIGTTGIAINRASANLVLTGITSIDGNAATATKSTNLSGGNNTTLLGAIGYQSNTDTTTLLSPNTSTTKNFLTQTGNGTNGAAPSWGTLAAADIPVHYIGTTSITFNRASATQSLTGISIDGNAGTVTNGFYTNSSFNLGTTSITVNRASASQSLTGISIDGSAGSVANSLTISTGLSGTSYNGSSAVTIAIDSTVTTLTGTQTLTNKRVTARVQTITSAASITPTADTCDMYTVTALATAAAILSPSGTPTDGQRLMLRIKSDATNRSLTWTTTSGGYRALGIGSLPSSTVASKTLYVGCIYNAQDTYWDVVSYSQQ
jgi:hypothetical protein